MAVENVWIEKDNESSFIFFYCQLCPLSLPFLKKKTAESYLAGHVLNPYHKRRLELQR